MAWVSKQPAIHNGAGFGNGCVQPDSEKGTAFGPWSIWQCDECKAKWRFTAYTTVGDAWERYVESAGWRD